MIEIVRCDHEPAEGAAVFTVYKTKEGVISGYMKAAAQIADSAIVFSAEPFGMSVEEAFQHAVNFCIRHQLPTLIIKDPDGLWPDRSNTGTFAGAG